ncbi:hypothetical protein [Nocardioides sp.]|uniref:hypothetical protein n=1 Tax=Nocardioides sp. TaxID=35761 RepID=UPI00260D8D80|nr:hypothetical protein [Nocardioides sp.]
MFLTVAKSPTGGVVWRPSLPAKVLTGLLGLVGGTACAWLLLTGDDQSLKDQGLQALCVIAALVAVPPAVFRWRVVLERDELLFVFLSTRRLPVRDIVQATCSSGDGVAFVCADGRSESTSLVGNGLWSHRRTKPTDADLMARTVLCAAAEARGEAPPTEFRLPPVRLTKRQLLRGGVFAFLFGAFFSD